MKEKVILVNEKDEALGLYPKIDAHKKGLLHRAFSVFIFNKNKKMMLQRRAKDKYHSPAKWTNTCCSHQRELETNIEAGKRRLLEEMGFTTSLKEITSFVYKASFENGLTEHEFDHVLVGIYNDKPQPNAKEVDDWKWVSLEYIKEDISKKPQDYTVWFKIIMDKQYHHLQKFINNESLSKSSF